MVVNARKQIANIIVLIVPLWNWNNFIGYDIGGGYRSNRTFMELKYDIASQLNTASRLF